MRISPEVVFLSKLNSMLKYLDKNDRQDIVEDYKNIIFEKYQDKNDINEVINALEEPEVIANNYYQELGVNNKAVKKKQKLTFGKFMFANLTFWLFILLIIPLSVSLSITISGLPSTIYMIIVMSTLYEPITAFGASVLAIGLVPLITIGFFLLFIQTLRAYIGLVSVNKHMYGKITPKNDKLKLFNTKLKKIVWLVLFSTLTLLTLGGVTGFFAGSNTLLGSHANNSYIHEITLYDSRDNDNKLNHSDVFNVHRIYWSNLNGAPDREQIDVYGAKEEGFKVMVKSNLKSKYLPTQENIQIEDDAINIFLSTTPFANNVMVMGLIYIELVHYYEGFPN